MSSQIEELGETILDTLKSHLRGAGVRYGRDKKLRQWLADIARDTANVAWMKALKKSTTARAQASLRRQALLIAELIRVREARAMAETFQQILNAVVNVASRMIAASL